MSLSALKSRLTIRAKLFAAFALLAAFTGSGGVLAVFQLQQLVTAYRTEQDAVEFHEALHEDRIAVLTLAELVRHVPLPDPEPEDLSEIQRAVAGLKRSTQLCVQCHDSPPHAEVQRHVEELERGIDALLGASMGEIDAARERVDAQFRRVEGARETMELRFHEELQLKREAGQGIFRPTLWHQLAVVGGCLAGALILSWLMARALMRPMLPLIDAARRIASGEATPQTDVPQDPDLAQVARALNESAARIARQAQEEARRQLLGRTLSSQEDERKRISRELHDELGQSLSALLMEIRAQAAKEGLAPEVRQALEAQVSKLIDDVRKMAWNLRPSLLDDLGLPSALGRCAAEMNERYGIPIDYQTVGFDSAPRLPGHVETVLYRVAQEALHNVVRHAKATRASVVLVRRSGEAALLVEDDGSGFDLDGIRRDRASLGILGMEERVSLAGGTLTITSAPGSGTSVRAQIPATGAA